MKWFTKIYWYCRTWIQSFRIAKDVVTDALERDWTPDQVEEMQDHRLAQWVKNNVPVELQ